MLHRINHAATNRQQIRVAISFVIDIQAKLEQHGIDPSRLLPSHGYRYCRHRQPNLIERYGSVGKPNTDLVT